MANKRMVLLDECDNIILPELLTHKAETHPLSPRPLVWRRVSTYKPASVRNVWMAPFCPPRNTSVPHFEYVATMPLHWRLRLGRRVMLRWVGIPKGEGEHFG